MYAKLFSRITESSLMEEPINVRYTFVMMLAIADPKGYVIGTDVAISRRLNMPTKEFRACVETLMSPDEDSNSKEEDGRRVIESDSDRGYKIVNYLTYRELRDKQQRREYMRTYMKQRRCKHHVNNVNSGKLSLAQEEGEEEAEAEVEEKLTKEDPAGLTDLQWDALVRTAEVPKDSPSKEELAKIVSEFPLVKQRRPSIFHEIIGLKFHQKSLKDQKLKPIRDVRAYLAGLEKKFSKNRS